MKRIILTITVAAAPLCMFAQTERTDSADVKAATLHQHDNNAATPDSIDFIKFAHRLPPITHDYQIDEPVMYRRYNPLELNIPELALIPAQATVASWHTGEVVATGGSLVLPGMMKIDSGSIGVFQTIGRLSFYAGAIANKYGYFRGLTTQYGINGSVSYAISSHFTATAFGTYYFGNPPSMAGNLPMPPSMAGYYGTNKAGGYVDCKASDNVGIEVGVQTVKRLDSKRYEMEPIATPYVKVGKGKKKIKIGIPAGQMIFDAIKRRR